MSYLILEFAAAAELMINGATIRFCTKSRLALTSRANFMLGKQIMKPDAATTPLRRLYLAWQTAYVGPADDFGGAMATADFLYGEIGDARLTPALDFAHAGEFYPALKIIRGLITIEDVALGAAPDVCGDKEEAARLLIETIESVGAPI